MASSVNNKKNIVTQFMKNAKSSGYDIEKYDQDTMKYKLTNYQNDITIRILNMYQNRYYDKELELSFEAPKMALEDQISFIEKSTNISFKFPTEEYRSFNVALRLMGYRIKYVWISSEEKVSFHAVITNSDYTLKITLLIQFFKQFYENNIIESYLQTLKLDNCTEDKIIEQLHKLIETL